MCLCVVLGNTCFTRSKVKYMEVEAPCMFLLEIYTFESQLVTEFYCFCGSEWTPLLHDLFF